MQRRPLDHLSRRDIAIFQGAFVAVVTGLIGVGLFDQSPGLAVFQAAVTGAVFGLGIWFAYPAWRPKSPTVDTPPTDNRER